MGDGLKRARDAARATRGLPPEVPKLGEIAERIAAHLARFEADPVVNAVKEYGGSRLPLYYQSGAYPAGAKVGVVYINFQYHSKLSKRDALDTSLGSTRAGLGGIGSGSASRRARERASHERRQQHETDER